MAYVLVKAAVVADDGIELAVMDQRVELDDDGGEAVIVATIKLDIDQDDDEVTDFNVKAELV